MARDGLEDPGHGQVPGPATREGGRDLNSKGGEERGPGDPDDDGEGVDESLVRDSLVIEHPTDLGRRGHVVRKGPADEMPERPRDGPDDDDEEYESAEAFDDSRASAPHGVLPCSAVALPVPVTVTWSMPASERICMG